MTDHFTDDELKCKCGCGVLGMDASFMDRIENLRVAFDKPMSVSSGYRCPTHNSNQSSTGKTGPHTTGKAIDIHVFGEEAYTLLLLAMQMGFTGVGVRQKGGHLSRFIHIDDLQPNEHPRPRVWSY